MSDLFTKLKKWGARPEDALRRVLSDSILYEKLLKELAVSVEPDMLHLLLDQKDYSKAFQVSHNLKGSAVYLSLIPLEDSFGVLTELLRPFYEKGQTECTDELEAQINTCMKTADKKWREFCSIIEKAE
jgi:hypothetical protein